MSEKYRVENSHSIGGRQTRKVRTFWAPSKLAATTKFGEMRKKDPTIQEAGLFRVRDDALIDEYIGYI